MGSHGMKRMVTSKEKNEYKVKNCKYPSKLNANIILESDDSQSSSTNLIGNGLMKGRWKTQTHYVAHLNKEVRVDVKSCESEKKMTQIYKSNAEQSKICKTAPSKLLGKK